MWFMRSKLKIFFENCQIAKQIGYNLPDFTHVELGNWHSNNFVLYTDESDNYAIRIKISKQDELPFYDYVIKISIKGILIYENGWKHHISQKMKNQIYQIITKLVEFNKECDQNKIRKTLLEKQKAIKKQSKAKEIEIHQFERDELINLFK